MGSATSDAAASMGAPEIPTSSNQDATQRGRRWRVLPIGVLVVLMAGLSGFPPASAFGATLVDAPSGEDDPIEEGAELPSTDDSPDDDSDPVTEVTDEVTGEVEGVVDTLGPLPENPLLEDEEDDGEDKTEDPEGDDPAEEEEEQESRDEEEEAEEPPAADDEEETEETSEPSPRTAQVLAGLRTLDASTFAPIVAVEPGAVWNYPTIDYVDVPLGPRSTKAVIEMLEDAGASSSDVAGVLAPFPVAGEARYSNDWGAPRHNPYYHPHEGTDVFASRGTPVVSSFDGVVTRIGLGTSIGGNSVRVTAADGTYAYYAHLDRIAAGLSQGHRVRVGDVLGTVGSSGNARGGLPHLHYEIHPGGGDAEPPLPYLDSWLADAHAKAEAFVGGSSGGSGPVAGAALPPRVQPPTVNAFENAASRRDSPAATLVLVAVLGGAIVALRQRHRFAGLLTAVSDGISPLTSRLGFGRFDQPEEQPVRDVLAPILERESSVTEDEDAS